MPLEYYLRENGMTDDPEDYMAVSITHQSFTIDDVYEHMTRQGSTVTQAEALAAFEEVVRAIADLVKNGFSVKTPLVNISSSISGVFKGDGDMFDPDRHEIHLNFTAGTRLRDLAKDIPTRKVQARQRVPRIAHYVDNSTEDRDAELTPGGGGRLLGALLKFDESDSDQGIFFINVDDDTETRVQTRMMKNKPSELIFINPDLPAGTYKVQVRSVVKGATELRTGTLEETLTVT